MASSGGGAARIDGALFRPARVCKAQTVRTCEQLRVHGSEVHVHSEIAEPHFGAVVRFLATSLNLNYTQGSA
jgi:hypothetical protein